MIHVENIGKSFGHTRALNAVSFDVSAGEYAAILGVNGAGKTTLVKILSTLSRPSSGGATVCSFDLLKNSVNIRSHIGVMTHHSFLYPDLSALENLQFYARMYGISWKPRADELLDLVGLYHRRYDPVRTFSRGMQQRLSLARAILHKPQILLLDEPFAGLDVKASGMLKRLIHDAIVEDTTVLLTTHDVDFAVQNASRILMLHQGQLMEDCPAKDLSVETVKQKLLDSAP